MTASRARKIFINLPVSDLSRSIAFFTKLGFSFDARFTGENAACMIVSEEAYVMLCVEKRFKDFTKKQICDTKTSTEALFTLACESRAEVDELVKTAVAAGGSHTGDEPQDHGFMYDWSFYDPDGHGWGVFHMAPSAIPQK